MDARFNKFLVGAAVLATTLLGACDHKGSGKLVTAVKTEPAALPVAHEDANTARFAAADARSAETHSTAASTAVTGTVTFRKDALFDREFLYGFDLQYSSGNDADLSLIPQSEAIGHIPSFFRRLGGELQLLADQSRLYESDVNHPELLLATYKITAEDADTLTVAFESGGLVLNETYNGKGSDAPKQVWVRSLQYVEQGNYLLQETALLLKDGTVQTFMESVFPRSDIVPEGYKPLSADPAVEPAADRYRLLSGEQIYTTHTEDGNPVRTKTAFASRYNVGPNGTIDWYVTPNIPDKLLPVVKSGIEGWNRYFQPILGRDVMRFVGRLPADVKLGDPRYNVVNYDTVQDAGAAYESQAQDPFTGIQSHSLIYLPYAWYNIGAGLWKKRADTHLPTVDYLNKLLQPKGPDVAFGSGRRMLACVESTDDVALPASLMIAEIGNERGANVPVPLDIDEFSKRLMMSTLFHEVGHALGFDHQFKGSLSYDGTRPVAADNATTYSVMDYNYYQLEQDLFKDIGGSSGPVLEYDRQVISQLYNNGKDVKDTDPVIAACNDAEADNTAGGADPLCVRYDSENNPSLGVVHAYGNFVAATGAEDTESKTFAEQIATLKDSVQARFASTTDVPTADALQTAAKDLGDKVGELANYFIAAGAQSVRANLNVNNKALRVWKDKAGVEDEAAFRGRYAKVLREALAWRALPDVPAASVKELAAVLKAAALANPSIGASDADRATNAAKAVDAFNAAVDAKVQASLTQLRKTLYSGFGFDLTNPFALSYAAGGELTNFEDIVADALAAGALVGLEDAKTRDSLAAERTLAATTLLTFKGATTKIDGTTTQLKALVDKGLKAGDAQLVTAARQLLKILNG